MDFVVAYRGNTVCLLRAKINVHYRADDPNYFSTFLLSHFVFHMFVLLILRLPRLLR